MLHSEPRPNASRMLSGRIKKTLEEIGTDPRVVNAFNIMTEKAYALGQIAVLSAQLELVLRISCWKYSNGLERQKSALFALLVASVWEYGQYKPASAGNTLAVRSLMT